MNTLFANLAKFLAIALPELAGLKGGVCCCSIVSRRAR